MGFYSAFKELIYMFIAKLNLDILGSVEIWYTDHTAHYYELQEQYLKNIIINIIWINPQ